MSFLSQVRAEPESTAVKLHVEYNKYTSGQSCLADWQNIVKLAGDQGARIIFKLAITQLLCAPSSRLLRRDWRRYLQDAEANPEASGYPVSVYAKDVAEYLYSCNADIAPEYVAQCIDRYKAFMEVCQDKLPSLWQKLPASREFAVYWFVDECRYGNPSMRMFRLNHPKFVQWLLAYARNDGTPERLVLELIQS